jgi:hypothetical protein
LHFRIETALLIEIDMPKKQIHGKLKIFIGSLVLLLVAIGVGIGIATIQHKHIAVASLNQGKQKIPASSSVSSISTEDNITGKYYATTGDGHVELDVRSDSGGLVTGVLSTGTPGCGGSIKLIGNYNSNTNILTARNANAHEIGICRMKFKFHPGSKSFQEINEGLVCSRYHGASCGFGFYYHSFLKKDISNQPENSTSVAADSQATANHSDNNSSPPLKISERVSHYGFDQLQFRRRYLRIVSFAQNLTILGIIVNDGNCRVRLKTINLSCMNDTASNPSCKSSIPVLPATLNYGNHINITVHCAAYKVDIKTNKGEYVLTQEQN